MEHGVDDESGGSGPPYGLVDASGVQQLQHLAGQEDEDEPENLTLESLGIKPDDTNLNLAALLQREGAVPTGMDAIVDPMKKAETLVFMSRKRKKRDANKPRNPVPAMYYFTRDRKDMYERELMQQPIWNEIKHDRYKINTILNNRLMEAWSTLSPVDQQPYLTMEEQDKLRYAEEMRKHLASKAAQEYALSKQETTKIRGSTTHRFIDELESHDFPLVGLRDPKSRAMNAALEAEIEQLKKDSLAHGSGGSLVGAHVVRQSRGNGAARGQVTGIVAVDSPETHYKITYEDGSSDVAKESEVLTMLEPSASASSAAMAASSVDRRHITLVGMPVQRREPAQIGLVTGVLAQAPNGAPYKYQVYIGDSFEEWSVDAVRASVVELDNPAIASTIMNLSAARGVRKPVQQVTGSNVFPVGTVFKAVKTVGHTDLHYVGTVTAYSEADDTYEVYFKPMLSMQRGMHEEVVRLPRHAVTILANPAGTNWKDAWSYEYFQGFRPFADADDLLPPGDHEDHSGYYESAEASQKRLREEDDAGAPAAADEGQGQV